MTQGSHGLYPRHPAITERAQPAVTPGDQPETRSRLTSKSSLTTCWPGRGFRLGWAGEPTGYFAGKAQAMGLTGAQWHGIGKLVV